MDAGVILTTEEIMTHYSVPRSSEIFTGRKDILERLSEYFGAREGQSRLRRSFLLYGLGGTGKTQICMKFAELYGDR